MQAVRHFMLDAGWTQQDLAAALGANHSYVSLLLRGKRTPSLKMLRKMAAVTQIPVERLVAESGQPPSPKKRIPKVRAHV